MVFGFSVKNQKKPECTPGRTPFHPSRIAGLGTARFMGQSASRNTFSVSTITDGNARVGGRSTLSSLTLAWLYIEPSPCGGVRPAGDPVDSDPGAVFEDDPHPWSDAGRPLEPWVCHHIREPTVLFRVSCRPYHLNVDRFHQPCLLPWRTPYCHRNTAGLGRDRWGLSSPYHVAATYPFWAARLSLLVRLTGGIATPTWRYHGRMLIHPSPLHVPLRSGWGCFADTQARDPCESAAACCWPAFGTPISLATSSTSLIHSIASVGNCDQVHTSVLNLIFQQANVAGVVNLSKWGSEICSRCWSAQKFFGEWCWRRRCWICKNVSRYTMCVPNVWRPIFCGSAFL